MPLSNKCANVSTATLVTLLEPLPDEVIEGLASHDDVTWSTQTLTPSAVSTTSRFTQAVNDIEATYLSADFLGCMVALQRPDLDVSSLLAAGETDLTAKLLVLSAACAEGAGDISVAEAFLRRAFLLELDLSPALRETTPELQAVAERVRVEANQLPTLEIPLQTRPSGLPVSINGRPICASTPCSVRLRPGPHLIQPPTSAMNPTGNTHHSRCRPSTTNSRAGKCSC